VPSTAGPYFAELGTYASSSSVKGVHAGAPVYSSPAGNGSLHSFSSTTWTNGDCWQFKTSTLGFSAITVSYDQVSSSTGPGQGQFQYSTDGVNFVDVGSPYNILANAVPNPFWNSSTSSSIYTYSYDLSSVTALNNQVSVYFRITDASATSASGGIVGTSGTDRIDNVIISVVPEPQNLFWLGGFALLAWNFARRRE
jgi:hypothetical protein